LLRRAHAFEPRRTEAGRTPGSADRRCHCCASNTGPFPLPAGAGRTDAKIGGCSRRRQNTGVHLPDGRATPTKRGKADRGNSFNVFAGGKSKVHDLAIHGAGMQTAGKTDCLVLDRFKSSKRGGSPFRSYNAFVGPRVQGSTFVSPGAATLKDRRAASEIREGAVFCYRVQPLGSRVARLTRVQCQVAGRITGISG